MKNKLILLLLSVMISVGVSSCLKSNEAIDDLKKSCLYDSEKDYFNKWANVFTVIETKVGSTISTETIYPIGYFHLSNDGTYSRMSNGVPLSGNWDVSDSCKLVLDPQNSLKREFDVVKLTLDSLTLKRTDGNVTYTQHYVAFHCFDQSQLIQQWDNTVIIEEPYNGENTYPSSTIYPDGYFTLNANKTYDRLSNGVFLAGSWMVNNDCKLVLDKGTNIERAFDIQKLTTDSLIIWRKDTVAHVNYLQKYVKH